RAAARDEGRAEDGRKHAGGEKPQEIHGPGIGLNPRNLESFGTSYRFSGRSSGPASITQIRWPVVTGEPGATEISVTVPAQCAVTSFSIFIASTMQSTWPTLTVSPSVTVTASTVPCIGLPTTPDARPPPSEDARSRRRRASARYGGSGTSTFTCTRRPSTSATVVLSANEPSEA